MRDFWIRRPKLCCLLDKDHACSPGSLHVSDLDFIRVTGAATFLRCATRWHHQRIGGHVQPATDAQARGVRVHKILSDYLKGQPWLFELAGTPDELKEAVLIALSAFPHLPTPPSSPGKLYHTEEQFYEAIGLDLPPLRGTPDLIDDMREGWHGPDETPFVHVRVTDYKTTSDLQYALPEEQIPFDFQTSAYAVHAANKYRATMVTVRFLYLTTKPPYQAAAREARLDEQNILDARTVVHLTLAQMVAASIRRPADVTYNLTACRDYASKDNPDGCPHREACARLGRPTQGPENRLQEALDAMTKQSH